MNLDTLNKWLTLVANVGVVAGIVFLAYEIRQNTESIQSQTRAALFAGGQEELWKNMEFPDVTENMLVSDRLLSNEERIRLDAWLSAALRAREYAWQEYQNGNIDAEHWQSQAAVIRVILGSSRPRRWWTDIAKATFQPEFAAEVDRVLSKPDDLNYVEKVLAIE